MKKNTVFFIVIKLIIAACFNVIFFINVKEPIVQTWISFGFINFSLLMILLTPLFTEKSKSPYLFGVVNTSISIVYFLLNLAVGLVSIIFNKFSVNALLSFFIILTAVYFIIFLLVLLIGRKSEK